eukprot:COSAG05_NODE_16580_length_342_cov_24.415638_1_plen_66_part_10
MSFHYGLDGPAHLDPLYTGTGIYFPARGFTRSGKLGVVAKTCATRTRNPRTTAPTTYRYNLDRAPA